MSSVKSKIIKNKNLTLAAILSIFLLAAVITCIYFIIYPGVDYTELEEVPEVMLTLILITGVAGLVACLSVVSVILSSLNLSNPKQALGLPKGSVRAMIALILIIIFAILSLHLYGNLGYRRSEQDRSFIPPTEQQERFAQQILTTISTLVVAVSAFYFGSRSVETAREAVAEAVAKPELKINPSEEMDMDITKEEYKEGLSIEVETTPVDEKITWEIEEDEPETLIQLKPNEFKYKPSENLTDGTVVTLTFTLAKYSDVSEKLTINIINEQAKKKEEEEAKKKEEEEAS